MEISLIVAMAKQGVIGSNNQLPWQMPADLAYFKRQTLGKPILMGRSTFESIGRPLPGRLNIVLSRDASRQIEGVAMVTSVEDALHLANTAAHQELMVIGGGQVYALALPMASKLYVTRIDVQVDGDAVFPEWNEKEWELTMCDSHQSDEHNEYNYIFEVWQRNMPLLIG